MMEDYHQLDQILHKVKKWITTPVEEEYQDQQKHKLVEQAYQTHHAQLQLKLEQDQISMGWHCKIMLHQICGTSQEIF